MHLVMMLGSNFFGMAYLAQGSDESFMFSFNRSIVTQWLKETVIFVVIGMR